MKKPEIYLKTTIEDIVFENRNKAYGAYQLRKDTDRYLKIGLLIGFMFVTILSAYSLSNKKSTIAINDPVLLDTTVYIVNDVKEIELPKPPPVETPHEIPQPTAQQALAELAIVEDANPTDEAPHLDELNPEIPIGLVDVSGPVGPVDLNDEPQIAIGAGTGNKKEDYVVIAGVMPEYIGGYIAMERFLAKEIDYPIFAKERDIEGTVYMSFIVNLDGSISDVTVVRGIGFGCDEEALHAVKKMKNWIPGRQNNVPVRVKLTIPIKFVIPD